MSEGAMTVAARALRQPPGSPAPGGATVEAIYRTGDVIRKFDADVLAAHVVEALTAAGLLLPEPAEMKAEWAVFFTDALIPEISDAGPFPDPASAAVHLRANRAIGNRVELRSRRLICTPWQREP